MYLGLSLNIYFNIFHSQINIGEIWIKILNALVIDNRIKIIELHNNNY